MCAEERAPPRPGPGGRRASSAASSHVGAEEAAPHVEKVGEHAYRLPGRPSQACLQAQRHGPQVWNAVHHPEIPHHPLDVGHCPALCGPSPVEPEGSRRARAVSATGPNHQCSSAPCQVRTWLARECSRPQSGADQYPNTATRHLVILSIRHSYHHKLAHDFNGVPGSLPGTLLCIPRH